MITLSIVATVLTLALAYAIGRRLKTERAARERAATWITVDVRVDLTRFTENMARLRSALATNAAAAQESARRTATAMQQIQTHGPTITDRHRRAMAAMREAARIQRDAIEAPNTYSRRAGLPPAMP